MGWNKKQCAQYHEPCSPIHNDFALERIHDLYRGSGFTPRKLSASTFKFFTSRFGQTKEAGESPEKVSVNQNVTCLRICGSTLLRLGCRLLRVGLRVRPQKSSVNQPLLRVLRVIRGKGGTSSRFEVRRFKVQGFNLHRTGTGRLTGRVETPKSLVFTERRTTGRVYPPEEPLS